ncbi:MAG: fused MFS/spermidine synthase, partial [Acidobacteriota bacterium]|nr:fused MFS/spermidine synthase [Acidobacteriota bacterium]
HFYLMISAGGALGGVLVGLIAPRFFNSFYEMPIGLAVCGVVVLIALRANPDWGFLAELLPPPRLVIAALLLAAFGFAWTGIFSFAARNWSPEDNVRNGIMLGAFFAAALLAVTLLRGGPGWLRSGLKLPAVLSEVLVLLLIGYVANEVREASHGYRLVVRNFYGGLKVRDNGTPDQLDATRTLTHGTINHGEEYLNPARRHLATTYYGPNTGVGVAIREKQRTGAVRIGVIGLGTGTIASYGRLGDYIRYYEINPLVLTIARTWFYFVPDCKAKLDVAMGDARLSLEREQPENFDVLAVDAFSSDSIPVHLLTREAMELYFHHLKPDGILAVHISNRYLDLEPVLQGEAAVLHKAARVVDTDDDETQDVFGATWVLITNPATGFTPQELSDSGPLDSKKLVRLWTDDYSNLFKILK